MALEPHLDAAQTQAIRLLTAEDAAITRRCRPRPDRRSGRGWTTIERGAGQITPGDWEDQIAKLKALLSDGDGDVRLDIDWSLQKKGPR